MKNQKPLEIVVVPENIQEFINLHITVKNFAEAGIDIPAAYVRALFELMYDPLKVKNNLAWEEAVKYATVAVGQLKKYKNYLFEWNDTVLKNSDETVKNDTPKVILEMIYAFFLFKNDQKLVEKDDVIACFYQFFDDEYKNRMSEDFKKEFTPRRQAIASGILTMSVGYPLSSKRDLSEEEIFQSTRNAIKKYLKD